MRGRIPSGPLTQCSQSSPTDSPGWAVAEAAAALPNGLLFSVSERMDLVVFNELQILASLGCPITGISAGPELQPKRGRDVNRYFEITPKRRNGNEYVLIYRKPVAIRIPHTGD